MRSGRVIRMRSGRVRPDEGQSGSTGCWPVGVDYPDATRIHLSFDRIRPGRFGRMRAGQGRLPLCGQDPLEFRPDAVLRVRPIANPQFRPDAVLRFRPDATLGVYRMRSIRIRPTRPVWFRSVGPCPDAVPRGRPMRSFGFAGIPLPKTKVPNIHEKISPSLSEKSYS